MDKHELAEFAQMYTELHCDGAHPVTCKEIMSASAYVRNVKHQDCTINK